jgi:hypothetical protein
MQNIGQVNNVSSDAVPRDVASRVLPEHVSFCGTCFVDWDTVVHSVLVSFIRAWVGLNLRRQVAFKSMNLLLIADQVVLLDEFEPGSTRAARLSILGRVFCWSDRFQSGPPSAPQNKGLKIAF